MTKRPEQLQTERRHEERRERTERIRLSPMATIVSHHHRERLHSALRRRRAHHCQEASGEDSDKP